MTLLTSEWDALMKSLATPAEQETKKFYDQTMKPLAGCSSRHAVIKPLALSHGFDNIPVPAAFSRGYHFPSRIPTDIKQMLKEPESLPEVDRLSPSKRSRVFTWTSTISDSASSEISTTSTDATKRVGRPDKPIRGSAAARRRYTCPNGMRTYNRKNKSEQNVRVSRSRKHDVESDNSDDMQGKHALWNSSMETDAFTVASSTSSEKIELVILRQPESYHRARYQKEGSRGCIKDRTGNSCPSVQLKGFNQPSAILQIFIGTESDPSRAHPLYRVCKVGGKHSTPCRERFIEPNIFGYEMDFLRDNDHIINVDCLGIMKLRNADFELSREAADLTKRRKRNPKVRLVFRAVFRLPDGGTETLQVVSSPICCTPSPGMPEIHFMSHSSCPTTGGLNVVVIGRNFIKDDSRMFIAEKSSDEGMLWEAEVKLLQENFNQVHLVGVIPPYRDQSFNKPVDNIFVYVRNKSGKRSELYPFKYVPEEAASRHCCPPSDASPPPHLKWNRSRSTSSLSTMDSSDHSFTAQTPVPSPPSYEVAVGYCNTGSQKHSPTPSPTPTPTASVSATNSSLQYCIDLPGHNQPIIITIPQFGRSASDTITAQPPLEKQPETVTIDLRQPSCDNTSPKSLNFGDKNSQQEPAASSTPYSPPSGFGSLAGRMVPGLEESDGGPTDDDIFNDLLREIMGMEDSAMDGLGYSTDYSASVAASSMSTLDINIDHVSGSRNQQASHSPANL